MAINIKILSGNTSNGLLDLSDRGSTNANRRNVINWDIKNNSNVGEITLIEVKSTSRDIFSSLAPTTNRPWTKWQGIVKPDAPYIDCFYTIRWKDKAGKGPYEHDPKIAVKPITVDPLIAISIIVVASLASLFLYHFLKDRKRPTKKMKVKDLH